MCVCVCVCVCACVCVNTAHHERERNGLTSTCSLRRNEQNSATYPFIPAVKTTVTVHRAYHLSACIVTSF